MDVVVAVQQHLHRPFLQLGQLPHFLRVPGLPHVLHEGPQVPLRLQDLVGTPPTTPSPAAACCSWRPSPTAGESSPVRPRSRPSGPRSGPGPPGSGPSRPGGSGRRVSGAARPTSPSWPPASRYERRPVRDRGVRVRTGMSGRNAVRHILKVMTAAPGLLRFAGSRAVSSASATCPAGSAAVTIAPAKNRPIHGPRPAPVAGDAAQRVPTRRTRPAFRAPLAPSTHRARAVLAVIQARGRGPACASTTRRVPLPASPSSGVPTGGANAPGRGRWRL